MSSDTYVAPNPMQGAGIASEGFPPAHPNAPHDAAGTTSAGVAPNPMTGNSGSPSGNNRQARVSAIQFKATQGVVQATTAFKDKPYLSTAVVLSAISVAFMIIACLAPWWQAWGTVGSTEIKGFATLFEYRACQDSSGSAYSPSKSCTIAALVDGATNLDYMYSAGAASFSMLLFAIIPGLLGFYATYLRRISYLEEGLPSWLWFLKSVLATPILHGVSAFFCMISFSIWAGMLNAHLTNDTFICFGLSDENNRSHSLSGGFAIVIIAFLFEGTCAALTFLFHGEVSKGYSNKPENQSASGAFEAAAASASIAYSAGAHEPSASAQPYDPRLMTDVQI